LAELVFHKIALHLAVVDELFVSETGPFAVIGWNSNQTF
jgi:hypothetical protein